MKMKKLLFLFVVILYSSIAYGQRSVDGSYIEAVQTTYMPGQTITLDLILFNGSTDAEWLTDVYIQFPAGVTVTGAINFDLAVPIATRYLEYDGTTGDGVLVKWLDPDGGFGEIYGDEFAYATVDVTIDPDFAGPLDLDYTIIGDIWGAEPHEISGTYTLEQSAFPVPLSDYAIYIGIFLILAFTAIRFRRAFV